MIFRRSVGTTPAQRINTSEAHRAVLQHILRQSKGDDLQRRRLWPKNWSFSSWAHWSATLASSSLLLSHLSQVAPLRLPLSAHAQVVQRGNPFKGSRWLTLIFIHYSGGLKVTTIHHHSTTPIVISSNSTESKLMRYSYRCTNTSISTNNDTSVINTDARVEYFYLVKCL